MTNSARGSGSLIGMLASLCILLLLALVTMGMWGPAVHGGKKGEKKSIPGKAMERANDVDCQTQLQQWRMAAAGGLGGDPENPGPPATAAEIAGGDASAMKCPLCGLPYRYDPSQYGDGKTYGITCRYPAHKGL